MQLAIDIYYHQDKSATCIGVLFNWTDSKPTEIIKATEHNVADYEPGQFYKRELPCVLAITNQVNLSEIESILVDGHVQLGANKNGLGMHLFGALNQRVPIIGVAKRSYFDNEAFVKPVLRGKSENPLFISAVGIGLDKAANFVLNMHGAYRFPTILKELDRLTKE